MIHDGRQPVGLRRTLAILFAVLLSITACEEDSVSPPPEERPAWWLEPDSMNLGILLLDYVTYDFEGGWVGHFAPCDTCDRDSLPFEHIFEPPLDVGSVTFRYTETAETLLYASVVYIGIGIIKTPGDFLPPSEFKRVPVSLEAPISIEYFSNGGRRAPYADADTAWSRVRCLDLVRDFASASYRVGIYRHNACSGSSEPALDTWVVFVYRGRSTSGRSRGRNLESRLSPAGASRAHQATGP